MYKCIFCNKEFSTSQQLAGHVRCCKLNPNKDYKKYKYTFTCKNCGKEYTLDLTKHQFESKNYKKYCSRSCANKRVHSNDTINKIKNGVIEWVENNQNIICKQYKTYKCKYCGKEYNLFKKEYKSRFYCCKECKHKYLSEHTGGYRKGSGIGKSGWYKGIYCDSSWELAFVIYHLENNLSITRCKERRNYIYEGENHFYYPDFITSDGIIEIKGYKTKQWEAKILQNPDIKVLYKKDIQKYIDYAISKYGENFTSLYEDKIKV